MASQALDSHVRRAERRRGGLHPKARCFSQEHGDAAGRHQRLLFDIFTVDHFNAHRLVLQTCIGTRRGNDDGFFHLWNPRECDQYRRRVLGAQRHVAGRRQMSCRLGADVVFAGGQVERRATLGVRDHCPAAHDNRCARGSDRPTRLRPQVGTSLPGFGAKRNGTTASQHEHERSMPNVRSSRS